jgi:hypothetical protein
MFCPKCRTEFRDRVKTCRYCKVDTVAELPPGVHPASQDVDPYPYKQLPPLEIRKLGNKKCPNCGKHQGWYRALGRPMWHHYWPYPYDWKCAKCQTALTYDHNRLHVLGAAVVVPLALGLLLFMGCLAVPLLSIFLPIPIILAILVYWSSVHIIRREEADRVRW